MGAPVWMLLGATMLSPMSVHGQTTSLPSSPGRASQPVQTLSQALATSVTMALTGDGVESHATEADAAGSVTDPATATEDEIFRRAFGGNRPVLPASDYPVVVNGIPVGEFAVHPGRADADGTVHKDLLLAVLADAVRPPTAETLRQMAGSGTDVAFASLRQLGFDIRFDAMELVLVINVPPRLGTMQNLQFRRARADAAAQVLMPSRFSAYASMRAGAVIIEDSARDATGLTRKAAEIDTAVNLLGLVGQANLRYRDTGRRAFTRGDVRLTYDDTSALMRYEIGDLSIARRSFQSGQRIAGISVARYFGIDPYRNIRPGFSQAFELTEPARVETLINGIPSRSFNLRAGQYTLRDIPLVSSAGNDIELRISYLGGRSEVLRFPAFFDFDLLAPGLVDFGFNFGVPYRDNDGRREYDSSTYTGSAYARIGVSSNLTLGLNWEGNRQFDLVGGDAVWASPVGTFATYVSTQVQELTARSSQLTFSYRWRDADRSRDRFVDAAFVLTGRDYRTLSDIFGDNYTARQGRIRVGQRLSRLTHAQLYAGYEQLRLEGQDGYYIGVNASRQISFGSLSAGLEYQWSERQPGPAVRIGLTVPLARGSLSSSYATQDHTLNVDYTQASSGGVGSTAVNAGLSRRDGAEQLYAGISYLGNRFEASATQLAGSYLGRFEDRDLRTELTFGTALVMADGHFGISRPVANSFALFTPHPKAGDIDLAIDPRTDFGAARTSYEAVSGPLGPAVLPNLAPYFVRGVQVDAPNAPLGTSTGGEIYMLRPGFRSGYSIVVGSEASVSLVGNLLDRDGDPLPFATGTAAIDRRSANDGDALQLFSNRAGRFFLDKLLPGRRYRLHFDIGGQTLTGLLDVPADAIGLVRLDTPVKLDIDVKEKPHAPQ
ncbi:hypothetical protein RM533_05355 [Croceicoccus sp. F390]|uniref:Fimbrial biogenesis outer membrane usher protein n=1 Tax=Croceicoccus esteveae TaxID=3075597 RepID=A0ABU2ZG76_9SPHN|nr:hypothetical protein [Croceicoccus sp. F390]MDT0575605.1 hypothetical protein [Croceicoccus sp. F390]